MFLECQNIRLKQIPFTQVHLLKKSTLIKVEVISEELILKFYNNIAIIPDFWILSTLIYYCLSISDSISSKEKIVFNT